MAPFSISAIFDIASRPSLLSNIACASALHGMRSNYHTVLLGRRVVLVPYRPQHVAKYHRWMADPYLQHMTGSEPLSLEEEVDMQREWADDDDKCTFIVLERAACVGLEDLELEELGVPQTTAAAVADRTDDAASEGNGRGGDDNGTKILERETTRCPAAASLPSDFVQVNLHAMVGDVNLFLSEEEEEEEGPDTDVENDKEEEEGNAPAPAHTQPRRQAELDIMIAEESARGQGMGSEASRIMLWYGARHLQIRRFFAKIKKDNAASRALFERRLGFEEIAYVECFGEYEYERKEGRCEDIADALQRELGFEVVQCHCSSKAD